MDKPKLKSRIDIIGQNGNNGEHYLNEEEEHIKTLIEDHWKYIEGVLNPHMSMEELNVIKFHYKSAMRHGWRHAKEYFTGSV
jgi:hypothetical protein